jgi:hypothetical protein
MKKTKLNHILPLVIQEEDCPASQTGKQKHFWLSTSMVEARVDGSVFVRFICSRCGKLHDEVFTRQNFQTYQILIENNRKFAEV